MTKMFSLFFLLVNSKKCFGMLTDGYDRAKLFNGACGRTNVSHATDMVHSDEFGIFFVDNVKAGSTMLRQKFQKILGISWWYESNESRLRTTTNETSEQSLANLFVFSIVRDPIAKFESGVRQAWVQNSELANFSADELLTMQLSSSPGKWVNEHLQPSTWRLTGNLKQDDGQGLLPKIPSYNFIGAIETIARDIAIISANIQGMNASQIQAFVDIEIANAREHTYKSRLSDDGIRRFCQSPEYKDEWGCLGYDIPLQCQ